MTDAEPPEEPRVTYGEAIVQKLDAYLNAKSKVRPGILVTSADADLINVAMKCREELVAEIDNAIKELMPD